MPKQNIPLIEDERNIAELVKYNLEQAGFRVLTAKGEETDKVAGLEVGADDYVTKPFSPREKFISEITRIGKIPVERDTVYSFQEKGTGNGSNSPVPVPFFTVRNPR